MKKHLQLSNPQKSLSWWKEIVMYQIYPRSFQDSNGDGIGDIRGIINRINYLKDLGINLIWLGPVYDSPNDDNGYDIRDYYKIHPEFGTIDDFEELLSKLHEAGIKLIMDLVVNHSSDEHDWFEQSRKSEDNPYRDFYFWRKGKDGGPPNNWKAWFGGDAWEYDDNTDSYYLHLFTKKQPDLNWENPKVRKSVYDIIKFWLDKGVDGFRMDVISLISKRLEFEDSPNTNLMYLASNYYSNGPRIHEYLQEMNQEVLSKYDIVTVGEGPGITAENAIDYIGYRRKELNMIFQLELMFLDNGPGGKFDPVDISLIDFKALFDKWDKAVEDEGWNNIFLDNHDFPRMVSRFGNDSIYRKESAKLLATFLLTMRGTPCIYQGSEIGMTNVKFDSIDQYRDIETLSYYQQVQNDGKSKMELMRNIHIQGRDNVRTPMQWDSSQHAGFTSGQPWIDVNPNFKDVNADNDRNSEDSVYKFYKSLIALRNSEPVLVSGTYQNILPDHPQLYFYSRGEDKKIFILLNFSDHTIEEPGLTDYLLQEVLSNNYDEIDLASIKPWQAIVFK